VATVSDSDEKRLVVSRASQVFLHRVISMSLLAILSGFVIGRSETLGGFGESKQIGFE
jgi:hypothetical protein